jgi:hypothetical protein
VIKASPTSCRHLVDKRGIVIAAAGLVDPPGHRPHANAILRGWPEARYRQYRSAKARNPHIDGIGGRDVVVGLQIASSAREVVQVADFAPSITLSKSSTHDVQLTTNAVRPEPDVSTEGPTPELLGCFLSVLFGMFRVV